MSKPTRKKKIPKRYEKVEYIEKMMLMSALLLLLRKCSYHRNQFEGK
jgi:hypothetical protein